MRISHEAIYQALYIQGRGALKRELVACLRTGRALRKPRERSRNKPQGHVTADVVLSERPAEAEDRAVPGHWEGDLIIGLNRSAIGTVVERSSRYTLLVHLPRLEGYGTIAPVKNGPALGGYGAIAMKDALTTTMTTMPAELLRVADLGPRQGTVRARAVQGRHRHRRSTSPTRTRPGSAARTRTPTACCASTSPRAPTCPAGPPKTSRPSPRRSTADPARSSAGRHPPKPSTSSYARFNKPVLQRPVESGQYMSRRLRRGHRGARCPTFGRPHRIMFR